MAIENVELMHEFFPKHPRMGTARMVHIYNEEYDDGNNNDAILLSFIEEK